MEPLAQVVETLWGKSVVVILPGELGLHIAARSEGLESLDDLFILSVCCPTHVFRRGNHTKRFLVSMSACLGRL